MTWFEAIQYNDKDILLEKLRTDTLPEFVSEDCGLNLEVSVINLFLLHAVDYNNFYNRYPDFLVDYVNLLSDYKEYLKVKDRLVVDNIYKHKDGIVKFIGFKDFTSISMLTVDNKVWNDDIYCSLLEFENPSREKMVFNRYSQAIKDRQQIIDAYKKEIEGYKNRYGELDHELKC